MAYWWDAELAPGATATDDELAAVGLGTRFADQATAEQWLGEFYLDLQDLGVQQVSLFESDRLVYGPMSMADA